MVRHRSLAPVTRLATALAGLLVLVPLLGAVGSRTASPLDVAAAARPRGGVNVEPAIRPTRYGGANPQSWWCVAPNCSPDFLPDPVATARRELAEAHALGASMLRVEFPWPLIETARGAYDWSRADSLMGAARQAGVSILPILVFTPSWAGGGLNQAPTNVGDWTAFVTAVIQRYGAQLGNGVDIWDEPDNGNYFATGSAQLYVQDLLNPAYGAIKAVNPSIPVLMAGSSNDAGACCAWVSGVIASGGRFDVAAFHDYLQTTVAVATTLRGILNGSGHSGTSIWVTEDGVNSTTGNQSQEIQNVLGGAAPVQAALWYNVRDTDSWTCCPPTDVVHAHWGLLNSDFSQKPAFATMQSLLGGSGAVLPPPTSAPAPAPVPAGKPTSAVASKKPAAGATPAAGTTPTPGTTVTPTASPSATPVVSSAPAASPSADGVAIVPANSPAAAAPVAGSGSSHRWILVLLAALTIAAAAVAAGAPWLRRRLRRPPAG